MTIHTPKVSCVLCQKELSRKGLNNHWNTMHLKVKNKSIENRETKLSQRIANYNYNPNKCQYCNSILPFNKRGNQFCNKSCSAKVNNQKHSVESRKRQQENVTLTYKNIIDRENSKFTKIWFLRCFECEKPFYVTHWEKQRKTCSDECRKVAHTKGGRKGGKIGSRNRTLRSKDEIALYELCASHFNNVMHNAIINDSWDADIILQEHKIAVLWNGPWHYKQMPLKNHSLKQVQTRDKIKVKRFTELGWKVFTFNDDKWSPEEAFNYLVAEVGNAPTKDSL